MNKSSPSEGTFQLTHSVAVSILNGIQKRVLEAGWNVT